MLVGRYALEVPLGSGGMGEVWRARDLATRQVVAVKLVQLASLDDPAQVAVTIARFRREADTLSRLRHPNIIASLAAGRVGNELFMVMELAEGMSLADMLHKRQSSRQGLFPVGDVLHIARQTCEGLAAAHTIGVVHRDIKPSNLMVSPRGHVMIVDFGIARLLEDNSPRLTATGETVGTLSYMSPEQAAGSDLDGSSDLYSFGCVLYELLAGRPPFVAEVPIALMYMHLQDQPVPMRNVRPDLPDGLPELVDRLLEKDPGARPPGAEYVARSLAAIGGRSAGRGGAVQPADRRATLLAGDRDTRLDPGQGPEAYRATVLDGNGDTRLDPGQGPDAYRPDVFDDSTRQRPRQAPGAPWAEGYRPTVAASGTDGYRPTLADDEAWFSHDPRQVPGQAEQGLPPVQPPWQQGDPGGSGRSAGGRKRRADSGPAGWPTARSRPRSRRLTGLLSSVLTIALVAGIAAYVWNKNHQALKVTAATVSVAHLGKIACNATVDVVGTIDTNGKGGPITYQWTKDGSNQPVGTVTAGSGQQRVRVDLKWYLRGAGTHHAVAIFQVFTPNVISAQSATFTYHCA
jgi:Protein kinase domain